MGSPKTSSLRILAICAILAVHLTLASSSAVGFIGDHQLGWIAATSDGCRGSIGECLLGEVDEELELQMDSESNRRILAQRRYISYGALRRNTVPCSRRGASYYNCRAHGRANPYARGCSQITRCRR